MIHSKKLRHLKWKHIPLVLLLQACGLFLFSQVRISGKVTDAENKGLPAISVTIPNTTFGASTDLNGLYLINANLPAGTYTLQFSGVGYKHNLKHCKLVVRHHTQPMYN